MGLLVNEIFFSIQGESTWAGRPCAFVRLSGCNLQCAYCDTEYARYHGVEMEMEDILEKVGSYDCRIVEITGGEPLLQNQTPLLVKHLLSGGFTVLMETNGSIDIGMVDSGCIRIVDIKCPASGQNQYMDMENVRRMDAKDELKFVLSDRGDYEYAKGVVETARKGTFHSPVLFSPVAGKLDARVLASWILADRLDVRLQLQLHKILWPEIARGV
ncbi:MAG: 7-carboxy-7-deazaguanine synthase QueE [Thermodesulfobacteriota bacterium]